MAKQLFGDVEIRTNKKLKLLEASGANFVSLRGPSSLSADVEFILPSADGTNGQVIQTNASGQLSFVTKVSGPGSATDNRIARFDGTTGALIQESAATLDDSGNLSGLADVTASGSVSAATLAASTALTLEETGAGTDKITLQAPASIAAPYTLTLPVDDGTAGQVLSTDGSGGLSWVSNSNSSFKYTWVTADTATKAITHSLNTTDVMVQIFDVSSGATIEIDSVVRTDANTVTVTASEAPPATNWRVLILAV